MKTTIEFLSGEKEEFDDAAPSIDPQEGTMSLNDSGMTVIVDDFDLKTVKRVIFEP